VEGLKSFIEEIKPETLRVKGFVNTIEGKVMGIQTVFDKFEYKDIEGYSGPTEIVAFGEHITPVILRKTFMKHSSQ
jgi:hypothetical protein